MQIVGCGSNGVFGVGFGAGGAQQIGGGGTPSLTESALFWLPGDEATGDMLDASGNLIDFTEVGTPGTATSGAFTGRDLDGATEHFERTALDLTGTWHMAAHIKIDVMPTGVDDFPILSWGSAIGVDQRALHIVVNVDGTATIHVSPDGFNTNQEILPTALAAVDNTDWYFIEAFHDAGTDEIGIAINGGLPWWVSYSLGIHTPAPAEPLQIGYIDFSAGRWGDGKYRYIGMWDRRLTADERSDIYGGGVPVNPFA